VESSIRPSLKRCPFRWQCPVNSPTAHQGWFLFNFKSSFILLAEGPSISPIACLSPVMDSRYFCNFCSSSPWPFSWQLQLRCRKVVQVLWTDVQIPFLSDELPFYYQQYTHDLAPISAELCLTSCMRAWCQSQTNFEVLWYLPSAQKTQPLYCCMAQTTQKTRVRLWVYWSVTSTGSVADDIKNTAPSIVAC
jgi:hypothetical protein